MEHVDNLMLLNKSREEIDKTISSYVDLGWEYVSESSDTMPNYTIVTLKWTKDSEPLRPKK